MSTTTTASMSKGHKLEIMGTGNIVIGTCSCGVVYRDERTRSGNFSSYDASARGRIRQLHRDHKAGPGRPAGDEGGTQSERH